MNRLEILIDGVAWYCGDVADIQLNKNESQVQVTGKQRRQPSGAGSAVSGLGDMLAKARHAQTAKIAEQKRQEAAGE